jgi:hypothetical protein
VKQFKVSIRLDFYELNILRVFLEVEESRQYSSIFLSFLKIKLTSYSFLEHFYIILKPFIYIMRP